MKKIMIISFSEVAADSRVLRQINFLKDKFQLIVVGYGDAPIDYLGEYISIDGPAKNKYFGLVKLVTLTFLGFYELYFGSLAEIKSARKKLNEIKVDLILANDMYALPLSMELKSRCGVIYDAHEYSPLEFSENWKWLFTVGKINEYFCSKHLKKITGMITVCDGIANKYKQIFKVNPKVVYNAAFFHNLFPKDIGSNIKLVHHGLALESRCLELMIDVMNYLDDRFTLDFYLVERNSDYYLKLKKLCEHNKNIRFMKPVEINQLPKLINQYDVGLYLLKPANFNSEFAMPNKFFEFVQGRVAIAVGPSPEMAELVRKYEMGVVAESFEPKAMAAELSKLTSDQLWRFKQGAHKAALELNYEQAGSVMLSEIERCLSLDPVDD
jgi:hypothetical protein